MLTSLPITIIFETTSSRAEKIFDLARQIFGITNKLSEAFWILPNGDLLDGSGKKDGGMPDMRSYDHREISKVFSMAISGNDAMLKFQNLGAIRNLPEYSGVDMSKKPTKQQYYRIGRIVSNARGEVIVEAIDNRFGRMYFEYKSGTSSQRILKDIEEFYTNGTTPVSRNRF